MIGYNFGSDMKTKYKFIHFSKLEIQNGRMTYKCENNKTDAVLAYIYYYPKWKQYVFTQADAEIIFNNGCLIDIVDFINQLSD